MPRPARDRRATLADRRFAPDKSSLQTRTLVSQVYLSGAVSCRHCLLHIFPFSFRASLCLILRPRCSPVLHEVSHHAKAIPVPAAYLAPPPARSGRYGPVSPACDRGGCVRAGFSFFGQCRICLQHADAAHDRRGRDRADQALRRLCAAAARRAGRGLSRSRHRRRAVDDRLGRDGARSRPWRANGAQDRLDARPV